MPTITNIEDLRRIARRRCPRVMFDYVDSGSYDEITRDANRDELKSIRFRQRVLVDTTGRAMDAELLGQKLSMPVAIAPTGLTGLVYGDGEMLAARAAEAEGTVYTLSTMSICTIEDIRAVTTRPFWFQLYVFRDRGFCEEIIGRARQPHAARARPRANLAAGDRAVLPVALPPHRPVRAPAPRLASLLHAW